LILFSYLFWLRFLSWSSLASPSLLYSFDSIEWTAIQWTISRVLSSAEKAIEWTFFYIFFYFPENKESI
jgi:hypothetical protein